MSFYVVRCCKPSSNILFFIITCMNSDTVIEVHLRKLLMLTTDLNADNYR